MMRELRPHQIQAERWLPVVGYEGLYEVSDDGRVRSLDRVVAMVFNGKPGTRVFVGCILRPSAPKGRRQVILYRDRSESTRSISRLVCEAFHGSAPLGHEAAHGDGNTLNDHASNLRWATHEENLSDKVIHGTDPVGSRNGQAKLTEQEVSEIKALRGLRSQRQIAEQFGIHQSGVSQILSGKIWGGAR